MGLAWGDILSIVSVIIRDTGIMWEPVPGKVWVGCGVEVGWVVGVVVGIF